MKKYKYFAFAVLLAACVLLGCICASAATYRTSYADKDGNGEIGISDLMIQLKNIVNGKGEYKLISAVKLMRRIINSDSYENADNWEALRKKEEIKVLFIGDSLTYYNDMPMIFKSIAKSAGKNVKVESVTKGGKGIAMMQADPTLWKTVTDKINGQNWDIIVFQPNRNHTVMYEYFPEYPWTELQAARKFVELIDDNGAIPLLYSTFGVTKGSVTRDGCTKVMDRKTHTDLINAYNASVMEYIGCESVFAGVVFNKIYEAEEPINLYHTDNSHPSYAGSYLVASAFYTMIFGEAPLDIAFTGELDSETAQTLRTTAKMLLDYIPTEKADVEKPAPAPTISFDSDKLTVLSDSEYTYTYTSGDGIVNAYASVGGAEFGGDTWSFSTDIEFTGYPGTGNPSGGFRLVQSNGDVIRLYARTAKANIKDNDPATAKYHVRVDAGSSSTAVDLGEFDSKVSMKLDVTPENIKLYVDSELFATITESGATFYEGTVSDKITYTADSVKLGLAFCYADVEFTNASWELDTGLSFGAHGYDNIAPSGNGDALNIVSDTELSYTYTSGDGIINSYAYVNGEPLLGDTLNFSFDVEFTGYPGTGNPSAGFRLLCENGESLRFYARTAKANITDNDPATAKYHVRVDNGSSSTATDLGEFGNKLHMQLEVKPDNIKLYIDQELFVTITESGATFYDGTVSDAVTYTADSVHLALAFCYADISFTNVACGR